MKKIILVTIASAFLFSCSKKNSDEGSSAGTITPGLTTTTTTTTESYSVNGKPAATYYGEFVHQLIAGSTSQYRIASATVLAGNDYCETWLLLFMFSDGRYKLRVDKPENKRCDLQMDAAYVKNTWQLSGTSLVLNGLGTGSGVIVNGKDCFDIKLTGADSVAIGNVEGKTATFCLDSVGYQENY